jgi:hypothetical protein
MMASTEASGNRKDGSGIAGKDHKEPIDRVLGLQPYQARRLLMRSVFR